MIGTLHALSNDRIDKALPPFRILEELLNGTRATKEAEQQSTACRLDYRNFEALWAGAAFGNWRLYSGP